MTDLEGMASRTRHRLLVDAKSSAASKLLSNAFIIAVATERAVTTCGGAIFT